MHAAIARPLFMVAVIGFPVRSQAVPVVALAYTADGTALVSNGDRRIDVRSPGDGVIQRNIPCDLPKIATVAFSPNGKLLAVGGGEPGVRGEIRLLSWPDGKERHRLGGGADMVTCVAFNTDGTRLGGASSDHLARVWQVADGTAPVLQFTLAGHAGSVLALAFSPSGQTMATGGADRSLKIWSTADGSLVRSLGYHTEAIHAISFRPATAGSTAPVSCATAGDDRTVRIWQPEIGRMVRIVRGHDGPVFALAWGRDGAVLFSAGNEGILRRIDGASDALLSSQRIHDDWIYALAVSPDGATIASGDWSGAVRLHPTSK